MRALLAIGGAALLVGAVVSYALVTRAHGQRDVARADLRACQIETSMMRLAFDVEKASAATALDAAARAGAEAKELDRRCAAAQAGAARQAEAYRAQLLRCQSAEAIAERLGGHFP